MSEVRVRPPTTADTRFIVDSWSKSLRDRLEPEETTVLQHGRLLAAMHRVLSRPGVTVLVAEQPGSEDPVVGWVVAHRNPATAWYVYVKRRARRQGVARMLVGAAVGPAGDSVLAMAMPRAALGRVVNRLRQRGWRFAAHGFVLEAMKERTT